MQVIKCNAQDRNPLKNEQLRGSKYSEAKTAKTSTSTKKEKVVPSIFQMMPSQI